MSKNRRASKLHVICSATAVILTLFAVQRVLSQSDKLFPGLVGGWYGEADLTNPKDAQLLSGLERAWDERDDFGRAWSAKWQGYVIAPATGQITFHVETAKSATVAIDEKQIAGVKDGQQRQDGSLAMVKGQRYPITVTYFHEGDYEGYLNVQWSWPGQEKASIPPANLVHSAEQASYWGWQLDDVEEFDIDDYITVPVRHVIVYDEPGKFCAWPANNGAWRWGNEILVGFELCTYKEVRFGHSRDNDKPELKVLARSLDGGETWAMEDPDHFVDDDDVAPTASPGNIQFAHPDFALRTRNDDFFISYDRGRNWQGPYLWPDFGIGDLSPRTDYIVNGPEDCLLFLSVEADEVQASFQDRSFCARTTDGGKTFQFLSWMTHNVEVRSVMSATVRIGESELVSAMRRRHDIIREALPTIGKNWIDVYRSTDNGRSWHFLSKVADTDRGERNGNPPSMVRLQDGRLCVAYGYRSTPIGIRAKISSDNGKTWSREIVLRSDGRTWDIGYTRMVQRPDGKLVTLYYFTTDQRPQQHIAATIWDPDLVR